MVIFFAHGGEHILRRTVLEARPAEGVLLRREDRVFDGYFEPVGLVFLEGVDLVQSLDEEQVGELLSGSLFSPAISCTPQGGSNPDVIVVMPQLSVQRVQLCLFS